MVEIWCLLCPQEQAFHPCCCDKPGWRSLGSKDTCVGVRQRWGEMEGGLGDRGLWCALRDAGLPASPPAHLLRADWSWLSQGKHSLSREFIRNACCFYYKEGKVCTDAPVRRESPEPQIILEGWSSEGGLAALAGFPQCWSRNHVALKSGMTVSQRRGPSLRNHRRKTLFAPGPTSWFPVPSFIRGARGVPCLRVPRVWPTSLLPTRALTACGPHSAPTGTILWGYIYLKPYKHKFVDRITIIIEQHVLGKGYETHKTFLFRTQWITSFIQYIVRIKILSFGEIAKNKRIKNQSIWIWPVFINKRIRIIRICGIWRWWQGEDKEKKI